MQRVRQESISSELILCGGGVRSILLLPLVARCLETIDVCIWRMLVLCLYSFLMSAVGFQRLPPIRGETAQRNIFI